MKRLPRDPNVNPTEQPSPEPDSVECRHRPGLLLCVALFWLGMALYTVWFGLHSFPGSGRWWGTATFTLPFLLLAGGTVADAVRPRILADRTGLRWRGIGRWHAAAWEDVSDYYLRSSGATAIVKTAAGLLRIGSGFQNTEALREYIARHALAAPVRAWQPYGSRPEVDLPMTCRYHSRVIRGMLIFNACCLGIVVGGALGMGIWGAWSAWTSNAGWSLVFQALVSALLLAGFFGWMGSGRLANDREAIRRSGQSISVDTHGLIFRNGQAVVDVEWDDVTNYRVCPGSGWLRFKTLYVVETTQGKIEFVACIDHFPQLRAAIQAHAQNARARRCESARSQRPAQGGEGCTPR